MANNYIGGQTAPLVSSAPPGVWDFDASTYVDLAAGALLPLPSGSGLVVVTSSTTGETAAFICGGAVTVLLGQTGSSFQATGGNNVGYTSGKISFYYNGNTGFYNLYNGTSSTLRVGMYAVRTRANS